MRILIVIFLLFMPTVSFSQYGQGLGEADMQKMMEQMQRMQECMQHIDQAKLKELEQRTYQIEAEIKSLCASGKRKKAEKKALAFGKEIANHPTMQEMQKCRENVKIDMPNMPKIPYKDQEKDPYRRHVCD